MHVASWIYAVVNYLDDFLVFGATYTFAECQRTQINLHDMIVLFGKLVFTVSWQKCSSPCSTSTLYLSILFNSVSMTMSLPDSKLEKLHNELSYFQGRKRATKRQLKRLCGIDISHGSRVVKGGRTFSHRIIHDIYIYTHIHTYIGLLT